MIINNTFFSKHKADIFCSIFLIIVFIALATALGPVFGDVFVDSPREAFIPEMMMRGKILHKDLFGWYNPLAYQFNTLLYMIFSPNFKVLYIVSYINAFLVLAGMYLISRMFLNAFSSTVLISILMIYYIFGNCLAVVGFIYPYAFGWIYLVLFFTFSTLFFLHYIKSGKTKYAYLSALFLGIAYANKPEFILCIIPVLLTLILKKEKLITIIGSVILIIIPTLISYGILFIQGLTVEDLKNYIQLCLNFSHTPEQIYYKSTNLMPPFNIKNIKIVTVYFLTFLSVSVFNVIFLSPFFKNGYYKIIGLFFFPICFVVNNELFYRFWTYIRYNNVFNCWEGLALFAIIIWQGFLLIRHFIQKREISLKDIMLFFIAVQGFLSLSRIGFFFPIWRTGYNVYSLLPFCSIWFYFFLSDLKFVKNYKNQIMAAFILMSLFFTAHIFIFLQGANSPTEFNSQYGKIITEKRYADVFRNTIDWVFENTNPDDTVLVLPEGVFVNYITKRPTLYKYYQLTPNHISLFGEDRLIEEFAKEKPKFIIINNYSMGWCYGKDEMCKDFGLGICNFVYDNYTEVADFEAENDNHYSFGLKIYKSDEREETKKDEADD